MKQIIILVLIGSVSCALKDHAKQIYVGAFVSPTYLDSDAPYKAVAAQELNGLTSGNAMKWDSVEPTRGQNNFAAAEKAVAFGVDHGMKVRGHTLIWHNQLPSWVQSLSKTDLESALTTHIKNVVTHFKGKIYAWDVCNEVLNEDGTLRDSIWHKNFNSSYIGQAFKQTHEIDSNAKLYINDYNVEAKNKKSDGLYNLVKDLKAQGVPIHGVGFQAHLTAGQVPKDFQSNMQRFADLGLDVAITELDIKIKTPITDAGRDQQAKDYGQVFQDCVALKGCVGVTLSGLTDKYDWLASDTNYGESDPWDKNMKPKTKVIDAIESALK